MPTETERGHGDVAREDKNAIIIMSLIIIATFACISSFYGGTIHGMNITLQSFDCKVISK